MLVTDLRCWRPIVYEKVTFKKSVDSKRRSKYVYKIFPGLFLISQEKNNIHNLIQKFKYVLFHMCFYPSSDLKKHIIFALNALKTNVFYHQTIRTKLSDADLLQKSNFLWLSCSTLLSIHAVIVMEYTFKSIVKWLRQFEPFSCFAILTIETNFHSTTNTRK